MYVPNLQSFLATPWIEPPRTGPPGFEPRSRKVSLQVQDMPPTDGKPPPPKSDSNNQNPGPSRKFEIAIGQNVQKHCKVVVRCKIQSTVGFLVFPTSSLSPETDGCSPECFPCPSLYKEYFPCPSQVLHTVLTKLCTCQSVVPTLWFICYLNPTCTATAWWWQRWCQWWRFRRVDGVICISQPVQNHVSADNRFRKVKLREVLRRLTRDQRTDAALQEVVVLPHLPAIMILQLLACCFPYFVPFFSDEYKVINMSSSCCDHGTV